MRRYCRLPVLRVLSRAGSATQDQSCWPSAVLAVWERDQYADTNKADDITIFRGIMTILDCTKITVVRTHGSPKAVLSVHVIELLSWRIVRGVCGIWFQGRFHWGRAGGPRAPVKFLPPSPYGPQKVQDKAATCQNFLH